MIKWFLVTSALVLISGASVVGQSASVVPAGDALSYGIKAGISFATFTGNQSGAIFTGEVFESGIDKKSRLGAAGGVSLTYHFSPTIALQPELLYVMKGARYQGRVSVFTAEGTAKLDFLQIPLLLKYVIPTQSKARPAFFAGPAIAFAVSKGSSADLFGQSIDFGLEEYTKSTDLSLLFGAGLEVVSSPSGGITIEGRYDLGLTNISDFPGINFKTSTFMVMAGWMFH